MKLSRFEPYLKYGFIVTILLFLALYLRDIDLSALSGVSINLPFLAIASLISLGFRYWGVLVWRTVLSALGATSLPSFTTLSEIYAKAWMARYIPGTVAWIGGKIYLANKHGISKSRLTVSSLVEAATQIAATLSAALILLGVDSRLDTVSWQLKLVMVGIGVGITVFLYSPLFNFLIRAAYRLIRRKSAYDQLQVNGKAVVQSYILYLFGALVSGVAYYFMASAIADDITIDMFWFIIGALSLAGAAGMATPLIPSGVGVREGIQLVLLTVILPKEVALVITIASRLWSLAIDVLFYALAVATRRIISTLDRRGE